MRKKLGKIVNKAHRNILHLNVISKNDNQASAFNFVLHV